MKSDYTITNTLSERYKRARCLARHVIYPDSSHRLTFNALLNPNWISGSTKFWYKRDSVSGSSYRLVDARDAKNDPAFNHSALAKALAKAASEIVDSDNLPIDQLEFFFSPWVVRFAAFQQRWEFDGELCRIIGAASPSPQVARVAPDKRYCVKVHDHNLWICALNDQGEGDGNEYPITFDGEANYAYATVPNMLGAGQDLGAIGELQVLWSPDSKCIFTVQLDMRQVKSVPVVRHVPDNESVRPVLEEYKYPMPGDDHMPKYRLVAIDIDSGEMVQADYPSVCFTYLFPLFSSRRAWWGADSRRTYFVDLKRGAQAAKLVEFDTKTGKTRVLFEESSSTWINLHPTNFHMPSHIMPLPESQELVWYSERSGWAHLYLYDLETGELKQTITQGEWVVSELLHFDAKRRELWLQTGGRVRDRDPYYKDICRVNVDTGELVTVASSDHDYAVKNRNWNFEPDHTLFGISSGAEYLVTTRSRVDEPPVSLLLDREGRELITLEEADTSGLLDNWRWPEPVQLKASDGETDIYGLVFRPSDFSSERSYPVIDNLSSLPAGTLTCKGFDQSHHYMCAAALAELGFIVVLIDGRGTPYRSRAFLDHADGWYTAGNDLTDHVAGIKQLAERYPYMDMDRVGIFSGWSTSVGPLNGLLQYPEFYKVGVTTGMPHSQLYMGLCVEPFEGPNHRQTKFVQPEELAANLQGKLLMMHGMLDILGLPAATFRMVEAFEKANKDFDLILLPNQSHAGGRNPYVMRRILDFFVRHLLGEEPPKDFDLRVSETTQKER